MVNLFSLVQVLGKNSGDEMTLRQLSKEAKVPYTTTLRLVGANKSLFMINKKGNIRLVSLNFEDRITKNYLIIAERKERDRFLKDQPMFDALVKDIPKGEYSLVLFGSRAEGANRPKSDVDLCIINKDGRRDVRFSKIELIYQLEVNPFYFTAKEFKQMLKDKEHNVGKEILKKHIILHGEEYFWNLAWDDGI